MDTYASAIGARARDGIASHGSLRAYIRDFRASYKLFEFVTAEIMSRKHGRAFYLWEDVALVVKDALGLPHPDVGIDITDTTTTIVQCKLRSNTLTWTDIGTFLGCALGRARAGRAEPETETDAETDGAVGGALCAAWSEIVVARNECSRLSAHAAFFANKLGYDEPITLADVESTVSAILDLAQQQPDPAAEPVTEAVELRDYQLEAIALCLKETERAACIVLPTGVGKSLVMARVAAREEFRVLIFVPLVALLEQMLDVLAANLRAQITAVGGAYEYDAARVDAARVVVCVYNSAHKIDATKFDRVLIDEAHFARAPAIYTDLEGGLDGETSVTESDLDGESGASVEPEDESEAEEAEDEEAEEAEASASPTTTTSASPSPTQSESRGRGYAAVRAAMTLASARLFSATLDVPDGAERCTRTLREMIDAGRLCDYRLNVPVFDVGATNTDLARFLVQNHRSIIVFCPTRAEGISFCAAMNEHGPCARYVDCDTPRGERREILEAFKSGTLAFVVNVRVLSVGFDAPITKGVCFVSMPASQTHIIQVIGRCLRVHPDKRCAQVIIPLVAGAEGEDKRARDFMRVLAQTDARVADALRLHRGAPYLSVRRVRRATALSADGSGDEQDEQDAADLLYTAVYDAAGTALTDAWSTRFDELVAFYEANGTIPPRSTPGGLATWVGNQRRRRATVTPERKARLDALPWWVWSVHAAPVIVAWSTKFDELVAFYEANDMIPPQSTPGLGSWLNTQRQGRATMPSERKARLEALGWWVWDPLDDSWSTKFDELVAFYEANGRLPPQSTPGGLGKWVDKQRTRRATMSAERKARLEALHWWVWSVYAAPVLVGWDARFDELVAYHAEHGTLPPASTPGGLGSWVAVQRTGRATMPPERKARLEALGWWVWNTLDDAWSTQFDGLVAYHAEHGRFPPTSTPGGLGRWVDRQRQRRAKMNAERTAQLNALPWWAWDPLDDAWSTKFDELVAFYDANGRLPPSATPDLGAWVNTQRTGRATMGAARKARLDALGWWVWRARATPVLVGWDARFDELVAYRSDHGICPARSAPGGLGTWVDTQRQGRATMGAERKARLDALGWWLWGVRRAS